MDPRESKKLFYLGKQQFLLSAEENFFCFNFFLEEMSLEGVQEADVMGLMVGICAVSYRNYWVEWEGSCRSTGQIGGAF